MIAYGDSSHELKYQLPDIAGDVSSGGILIQDTNGNVLKTDTFAIVAATTLAAAVSAGDGSVTLTSGLGLVKGDVIKLSGSGLSELVEIEGIDTSGPTGTHTAQLVDYVVNSYASGDTVTSRMLTYDLDASDTDDYPAGKELVIIWGTNSTPTAWDIDLPPQRETGEIMKRSASISGLQAKFSHTYPRYARSIEKSDWPDMESLIWERLRGRFLNLGRDIDNIVDMTRIEPLFLAELAYHLCNSGDDSLNEEAARLENDRDNLLNSYLRQRIWTDDNQDDIKADTENQKALWPAPSRGLW
jgi:hypothetical protein